MIQVIDLNFLKASNAIAAFLIETSVGPILVETGPYSTFPELKKHLADKGYQVSDIKHVFLSHIHLDHAGAAWAFAEAGAFIHVHPKGIRHLADPSKLMDSATRIYGDMMDSLWGVMKAIPNNQLVETMDRQSVTLGDTKLTAWHTPGHAVHHIAWQVNDTILLAGDVAGVKIKNGMVVPPCPPPDINIEDWQNSLNVLRDLPLKQIYLTHYGLIENCAEHLDDLERILLDWANWIKPLWEAGRSPKEVVPEFQERVKQQLLDFGVSEADLPVYEAANPSWMSVTGLMRYWRKKAEREAEQG